MSATLISNNITQKINGLVTGSGGGGVATSTIIFTAAANTYSQVYVKVTSGSATSWAISVTDGITTCLIFGNPTLSNTIPILVPPGASILLTSNGGGISEASATLFGLSISNTP